MVTRDGPVIPGAKSGIWALTGSGCRTETFWRPEFLVGAVVLPHNCRCADLQIGTRKPGAPHEYGSEMAFRNKNVTLNL